MANFDEIAHLLAIEGLENAEAVGNRRRNIFQERKNPLVDLTDEHFIRLFRLSKDLVQNLVNIVTNYIVCGNRRSALDVRTKVLIALRFFASGTYQMDAACNIFTAVSQSSVSRAIHDVVDVLNRPDIFNEYVHFPRTMQELEHIRNEFYGKNNFPGVIGCIDSTHIAIFPPKINDPEYPEMIYVNRKKYLSINVQLICDPNLKIINVNSRFPGSTNDAYIWRNSEVQRFLVELHRRRNNSFYLLGDSGYPLRLWLLTPLPDDPQPGTPEAAFNIAHKRTRCLIERCNGVLKMRFRCLLKHRVLHYDPQTCSKIINACVVLHNMCIQNNIPMPADDIPNDIDLGVLAPRPNVEINVQGRVDPNLVDGRKLRERVIRNYFH